MHRWHAVLVMSGTLPLDHPTRARLVRAALPQVTLLRSRTADPTSSLAMLQYSRKTEEVWLFADPAPPVVHRDQPRACPCRAVAAHRTAPQAAPPLASPLARTGASLPRWTTASHRPCSGAGS
eukprot:scaffold245673_cov32-Tisochrysis_lutea.AAC.5